MSRFTPHFCEEGGPRSTNLTVSLSPGTTHLSAPGSTVLTATASGGKAPYTYAWNAKFVEGTDASAVLSGSGASVTVTPTAYASAVLVNVLVTDSGTGGASSVQTATDSSTVSVDQAPALAAGADLSATSLSGGTTTTSFTFAAATGGGGAISYTLAVESSTGTVTLSTSSGRTASLLGLTDGVTVRVTCTATDSVGQTATSTGVWGVATAPVYDEVGLWNVVEEVNCQTLGSGSRTGSGTLTVGSTLFTVTYPGGAPTGAALNVDSAGARLSQTSGTGTVTNCWVGFPVGLLNFAGVESVLFDAVFEVTTVPVNGLFIVGFGDGSSYTANDFFGFQSGAATSVDTGNLSARRYQSSAATTYSLASAQTLSGTYAVQVLMVGQRISLVSASKQTDYLGGPRLGTATPMRGTWTGSPGGAGVTSGASIASAFTTLRVSWAVVSGNTSVTMKKCKLSRLTRPPSV